MPSNKTKTLSRSKKRNAPPAAKELPDVLTPADAALYLRVSEEDVVELAERGEIPGRRVKDQWRFHKDALCQWLSNQTVKQRILRHAGAAKDDPYFDQLLEKIYRNRGRPMDGVESAVKEAKTWP